MADLREQLRNVLAGRVCVVGVGNVDHGDDGLGPRLAAEFGRKRAGRARSPASTVHVLVAGISPEDHLVRLLDGGFDQVLFLDAVDCGAEPGAVTLLDAGAMNARFPQISTHRLSLGALARVLEQNGRTRAWLLGVQPASLHAGAPLSGPVSATVRLLTELLLGALSEVMLHEGPRPPSPCRPGPPTRPGHLTRRRGLVTPGEEAVSEEVSAC